LGKELTLSRPSLVNPDGIFETGPVFQKLHESQADIVILQGGTDSGKTYATMQELFIIASTTVPPKIDPIISIVNKSIPDSKKGAYRIAESIYHSNEFINKAIVNWNQGERVVTFNTGWIMEFLGATDEQSAKQGKRQYLFVNEANGVAYPIFWQYAKRTRVRTVIDYNPSAPFWAHEKLIGTTKDGNDLYATVETWISDHRHNPFMDEKDHAKTENIKDKDLWNVYARGRTGNLIGLIYPNWKQILDKDFPWYEERKFGGVDFGYTVDPTAAIDCRRIGNKIYVHELCYLPAVTAVQLKALYKANKYTDETPIYCEHDGDMIRQLRQFDLMTIATRKGAGSIRAGIAKVNEYEIYFTASSKNIEYERQRYMWMMDPDTGKPTNTPIDKVNHLMDAIRYAIYTHFWHQE